jgi:hypothetical protein
MWQGIVTFQLIIVKKMKRKLYLIPKLLLLLQCPLSPPPQVQKLSSFTEFSKFCNVNHLLGFRIKSDNKKSKITFIPLKFIKFQIYPQLIIIF